MELSQMRLRTMNEATGTDFMQTMKGHSRVLTHSKREAAMPRRSPAAKARMKPARMRAVLKSTVFQKAASDITSNSVFTTLKGDARSTSCPTSMLAICQTASAKITAIVFLRMPLFIA